VKICILTLSLALLVVSPVTAAIDFPGFVSYVVADQGGRGDSNSDSERMQRKRKGEHTHKRPPKLIIKGKGGRVTDVEHQLPDRDRRQ